MGVVSSVHQRFNEYQKLGLIKKGATKISAFIHVYLDESTTKREKLQARDVAKRISDFPVVESVSTITGEWDLIMKVNADNVDELNEFVTETLRKFKGIKRTVTSIILEEF